LKEDVRPDGSWIATPAGTTVALRRADSGALLRTLAGGHAETVLAVHFNVAGDRLVSGDVAGKIVVWNPEDGAMLGTLPGHRGGIRQFAARTRVPDLASASDDTTIKLWDLAAFREVRTLSGHGGPVIGLALAPDGRTLASASADGTVKLWDVDTGAELRTLSGSMGAVDAVDFDGRGTRLAAGGVNGKIQVWDPKTGMELQSMQGAKGPVVDVFLSQDGRWILAYQYYLDPSSKKMTSPISIWNADTGELEVADYQFESAVAPPDWPFRAVFREVARRAAHQSR
jgi:WD40 repeat protein